jgi:hypothetical protein
MKVRLASILLLLLCFAASGFSSSAMASVTVSLGEVICFSDGGWYIFFNIVYDAPLTNDDGAGGDYVSDFLYEDFQNLGGGIGTFTDATTYPWTGGAGILHSYGSSASIIVFDETNMDYSGPFDYNTMTRRDNVMDSMTVYYDDYCDERQNTVEASDTVFPPDNRINWQYGDLNAVLYRAEDSDGNPALNLYCYDGENTWLGLHITTANTQDAPIEANGCDVTLYLLETGQLQINIRDAEGKLYEIICSDLACESPIMRYFDWQE